MTYNLSLIGQLNSSFVNVVQVANNATNGILIGGTIIALFIIQINILSKYVGNIAEALTFSAWLCFIYSFFFSLAGLVNFYFLIVFLTIAALGTFYLYFRD